MNLDTSYPEKSKSNIINKLPPPAPARGGPAMAPTYTIEASLSIYSKVARVKPRPDKLAGTVEKDKDYLAFVERYVAQREGLVAGGRRRRRRRRRRR